MLDRISKIIWACAGVAVFALCFSATWRVWTMPAIPDLAPSVTKLNAMIDFMQRPCDAKDASGKALAPGTLCSVDKAVTHIGNLTVVAQKQVMQTDKLVTAASTTLTQAGGTLQEVGNHVNTAVDATTALLGAGTDTAKETTKALAILTRPCTDLLGCGTLEGANLDVADLDLMLKTNQAHLVAITANLDGMTGSGNLVLADLYTFEHKVLNPPPCKTRKCSLGRASTDLGNVVGLGSAAANVYHAFRPIKVHVNNLP